MKHDRRFIKYFDCAITARVRIGKNVTGVQPAPLLDILLAIKAVIDGGHVLSFRGLGDTQTWTLEKVVVNKLQTAAVLLVNRSDQLAADQAISDPANNHFSVAKKMKGQGNAYSSHIALRLTPSKKSTASYLVLQEDATGISIGHVSRLLRLGALAAVQSKDSGMRFPHPDASGRTVKPVYKFECMGHPSQQFIKELNDGELTGVELVSKSVPNRKFDGYNATEYMSRSIRLKPKKGFTQATFDVLKSVCANADSLQMEEVRVKFKDEHDIGRTVHLASKTAQLLNEDRFVRSEVIQNFKERLDTACKIINPEIRDKMCYLLK